MLSIILPTIRLERIPKFLESFNKSYSGNYELICVSPYDRPSGIGVQVRDATKLKWIIDKGNPVRCQQIGLCEANGEYIHRAVDDSLYVEGAMDIIMTQVNYDKIINIKFEETNSTVDRTHKDFQNMNNPKFYKLDYHKQALMPYVPSDTYLINFAIYPTQIIKHQLGGWECEFETVALAETDLSIRIKMLDIKVELTENIVINCDWMPGHEGDHGPIHEAFSDDLIKYKNLYSNFHCWEHLKLDLTGWQGVPAIWERRFKKGE